MATSGATSSVYPTELQYDVVIVGGGMVGSMLAAALAHTSLSVAVLEARQPAAFDAESNHDLRVSALSHASEHMLKAVNAWHGITERRACPYNRMLVWDGEQGGKTEFYSGDIGQTHLGHIVENRLLQLALIEQLSSCDKIDWLCPATLASLSIRHDGACVNLSDGRALRARLVIGADGAQSKVRELSGISIDSSAYPQHALVASIKTCLPQQKTTWQRFLPTGPQAFLPLSGAHASIVWYNSEAEVKRLMAAPEQAFIAAMQEAFPPDLGTIDALLDRGSFPLHRSHARDYVKPRVALIGDAAHTVHPLAGQGVNLGLLDAAVMAEVIVDAHRKRQDIGEVARLRRYERWRRFENTVMINALDGFYHAFKPQPLPVQHLRSLALTAADRLSPIKQQLTAYAMGLSGDLPVLAKGRLP